MNTRTSTLTNLATATKAELEAQNVKSLRQLATGNISGYSRMKKSDLIDALLAEGERLREFARSLDTAQASEELEAISINLADYTRTYFARFKGLVKKNLNLETGETNQDIYPDVSGLAAAFVAHLDSLSGQQANGGIADNTKIRYKSEVLTALRHSIQAEQGSFLKPAMESAIAILERALSQAFQEKYSQRKANYRQTIAERKSEKVSINTAPLLTFSQSVLTNVETLRVADWPLVSVAIAIATGRRMAEVHGTATKFERDDEDKDALLFTGQLKAKGAAAEYYEQNPSYSIPSLVYPELVIAGHEWLRKHGKLNDDAKAAHNRFSRYLSKATKQVFYEAKIGGESKKHTYKALRAIYGQVAFERSNAPDEAAYLAQILGHGRQDLTGEGSRIADFMTPQSYNSDWIVND